LDRVTNFAEIVARVKGKPRKSIAVAMADEDDVLRALADAYKQGIADAILVGDKEKILACSREHRIKISPFDIVPADSEQQSVAIAINMVR